MARDREGGPLRSAHHADQMAAPPEWEQWDRGAERVGMRYNRLLEDARDEHEWAYAWRSEITRGGFRAVDFLMDEVVAAGKCVGCAACVTVCPVDVFDYVGERPTDARTDACVRCVLCADVCAVLRPQDRDVADLVGYGAARHDDGYGPYTEAFYARTRRPEIAERAQDGGVATALLLCALERDDIRGAVLGDAVSGRPHHGTHRLATTPAEILACAGSRYTYSPNTLALREAMRRDVRPVAVVGVPCQIEGIRLQQNSGIRSAMARWYRENVALALGLFCSESFTRESVGRLARILGVAPERIARIDIKGRVVVTLDDGTIAEVPLARYREFARPACLYCLDYAAEHADVSLGGIGMEGWTLTVVRSDRGKRAVRAALDDGWIETRPVSDAPRGERLLRRLAAEKRRNRPHPARMPTLAQRSELGCLDPKTFYTSGPGAPPS